MLSLDSGRLATATIPIGTAWLLGACMEARGKQDLWIRQKPEALAALREQAMVQSAESSNRIEGVTVPAGRLRPLILGEAKPRDRSEEELAGYRRALDWIFSLKGDVSITPQVIRRLHAFAQGGWSPGTVSSVPPWTERAVPFCPGDAGKWKRRDNEITEIFPDGARQVRFVPTPARDTPQALETLCEQYRRALDTDRVPPLLVAATFVFDLLCVHPFRGGNGRVSRLVTTLLLKAHGFEVVRYVSLERLVEERKAEYYDILRSCSEGWHEGPNEIVPWWNYFLAVLRSGYLEFEQKVELADPRPGKTEFVRRAVLDQAGGFTLADLSLQLPAVSPQLIKKVLAELKSGGQVLLRGRGRGASWSVKAGGLTPDR